MTHLKVEIIETRDGSSSLFLPEMNETYHSTHGAITEAAYVFINNGLQHYQSLNPAKQEINILEIGFGTGLNVWMTAYFTVNSATKINYTSLEKFPLDSAIIEQLNYKNAKSTEEQKLFDHVHKAIWGKPVDIHRGFELLKLETDVFVFTPTPETFDIIFFDAFAPSKQPEMWRPEVLSKMYHLLSSKGIFVTYCAQGQFKRDLKAAGFEVETLQGPPGKKEMVRGQKP